MFGASSGLVLFFLIGACQCFVKSESPSLHRHQKRKQNTRLHQTCTGPQKDKKLKQIQELWVRFWGVVAGLFFVFFGACRCLVHLVVCLFFLFFVDACQCFVKSESQSLHRHQQNNKTKPVDAPNLHRPPKKQKKLESMTYDFWVVAGNCVFWCLSMFGASSVFFVPVNVFAYLMSRSWWKKCVLLGF